MFASRISLLFHETKQLLRSPLWLCATALLILWPLSSAASGTDSAFTERSAFASALVLGLPFLTALLSGVLVPSRDHLSLSVRPLSWMEAGLLKAVAILCVAALSGLAMLLVVGLLFGNDLRKEMVKTHGREKIVILSPDDPSIAISLQGGSAPEVIKGVIAFEVFEEPMWAEHPFSLQLTNDSGSQLPLTQERLGNRILFETYNPQTAANGIELKLILNTSGTYIIVPADVRITHETLSAFQSSWTLIASALLGSFVILCFSMALSARFSLATVTVSSLGLLIVFTLGPAVTAIPNEDTSALRGVGTSHLSALLANWIPDIGFRHLRRDFSDGLVAANDDATGLALRQLLLPLVALVSGLVMRRWRELPSSRS